MDIYGPFKTCSKCQENKPLSDFSKDKHKKDGLNCYCKLCLSEKVKQRSEYYSKYRENNRQKNNDYAKSYRKTNCHKRKEWVSNNKDKLKEINDRYYLKNRKQINERKRNSEKRKEYVKKYRIDNKEKIKEKRKCYFNKRMKNDYLFKMKRDIRSMIGCSFRKKGYRKKSKTFDILGCDFEMLVEHLEKQFDNNMSWNNRGTYWDIDHIIPLSSAKSEEDVLKLNHYSNLQPLESYYNRHVKRGKL
jgi:hypothetical protein